MRTIDFPSPSHIVCYNITVLRNHCSQYLVSISELHYIQRLISSFKGTQHIPIVDYCLDEQVLE